MLVTVGLMALALLAASLIRTVPSYAVAEFGTKIGGLRALTETERLIMFEDLGTSPEPDWSSGQRDDTQVGLGAIWLAAPADAPMTRRIALPAQTQRSIVTMDLIAIDAWTLERLELSVDGTPVLRQSFSAQPDLIAAQRTEVLSRDGIVLQTRLDGPQELGFETGPGLEETRLSVELAVTTAASELRLSIVPLPAADPATEAQPPMWAIDNLMVIAADR
ncbi:hypothetical protein [Roseicyclus sp.]|uniref:hypothetical protein n=1 Tax=Roseicyclus sp. TaxID=1914329 RepID=UPI003F6D25AA